MTRGSIGGRPYVLLVVALLAALLIAGLVHVRRAGGSNPSTKAVVSSSGAPPVYVMGPSDLVAKLVATGVNPTLIKQIGLDELRYVPPRSLVVIDWSTYDPLNASAFRILVDLMKRGDFLVVRGNDTANIEATLAEAWAKAYNASIVAMPVPKYSKGLHYVVAYGGSRFLLIGPHDAVSALETAASFISTRALVDPPTDDMCYQLMIEYNIPATNEPSQVSNTAYAIVYGPQSYTDPLGGTVTVDFCTIWLTTIDQDYNGYSVTDAQFYNYISFAPAPGEWINYLKSFQDAYASYLVYQWWQNGESGQPPGDVEGIASIGGGYGPGYWTNSGYQPGPIICTPTTRSSQIDVSTSGSGSAGAATSIQQWYTCPWDAISVTTPKNIATPIGGPAYNRTWVLKPIDVNAMTQVTTLATAGDGLAYMGPAFMPQPTVYSIPAGVSAVIDTNRTCILGDVVEHIVYDITWDIWVNPNGAVVPPSFGAHSPPPAYTASSWTYTNNGFHTSIECVAPNGQVLTSS